MKVGLVMLTYKESYATFSECFQFVLSSLVSSQFPEGQLDVLIVDNRSGPDFLRSLDEFCKANTKDGFTFSYMSESEHSSIYSSMNLGFHALRSKHDYDILAYSSNDVWVSSPSGFAAVAHEMYNDPSIGILSIPNEQDNSIKNANKQYCFPRLESRSGPPIAMHIEELVNFHFGLFSRQYLEAYNYRYPDVFLGVGTESLLGFCCAAVEKSWSMSRSAILWNGKVRYRRLRKGKGRGSKWKAYCDKRKMSAHPFGGAGFTSYVMDPSVNKTLEELILPGKPFGLGFQCFQRTMDLNGIGFWTDYDAECYQDGKLKNPEALYRYIKDNIFVQNPGYEGRFNRATKVINF